MEVDTNMINEQVFNSEWYEHNIPVWGKLVAVTDDDVLADNRQIIDPDWTTRPVDQYTVNRDLKLTVEEYKEENVALNNKVNTFIDKYDNLKDRYDGLVDKYTNLHRVAHTGLYTDLVGTPVLATVATSGDYNDLSNKPAVPSMSGYATQDWVISKFLENSGKWDNIVEYLSTPLDNVKFKRPGVYLIADADHDNNPAMFALVTADSRNPNRYYLSVLDINGASGGFAYGFDDRMALYFNDQDGVDLMAEVDNDDRFALRGDLDEMYDQIKTELMQEIKPTYSWDDDQLKTIGLDEEGTEESVELLPLRNGELMVDEFSDVFVTGIPSWVHVELDDTTRNHLYLKITADPNSQSVQRSGRISVRNHDARFVLSITQAANSNTSPYEITGVSYTFNEPVNDGREHEYELLIDITKNGEEMSPQDFENDGLSVKFKVPQTLNPFVIQAGHNSLERYVQIDADSGYDELNLRTGAYDIANCVLYIVDSTDLIVASKPIKIQRYTIPFEKPQFGCLSIGVNSGSRPYIELTLYTRQLTPEENQTFGENILANLSHMSIDGVDVLKTDTYTTSERIATADGHTTLSVQNAIEVAPVSGVANKYEIKLTVEDFEQLPDPSNSQFIVCSKTDAFLPFGFTTVSFTENDQQIIGATDVDPYSYSISGSVLVNGHTYEITSSES